MNCSISKLQKQTNVTFHKQTAPVAVDQTIITFRSNFRLFFFLLRHTVIVSGVKTVIFINQNSSN